MISLLSSLVTQGTGNLTIEEQHVITDYHLDMLTVGKTTSKKKNISSSRQHDIWSNYTTYSSRIEYLFAVAKYFGYDIDYQGIIYTT